MAVIARRDGSLARPAVAAHPVPGLRGRPAWAVQLRQEHFVGQEGAEIGHADPGYDRDHGTDVTFSTLPTDKDWIPGVIADALRYYSIPARVAGRKAERAGTTPQWPPYAIIERRGRSEVLDTHAVARSLTAADFTPAQADALTDALRLVVEQSEHGEHVTSDQFEAGMAEMRTEIAEVGTEKCEPRYAPLDPSQHRGNPFDTAHARHRRARYRGLRLPG